MSLNASDEQNINIKEFCEEIFDDYSILNFEIDGEDVVIKVKPKSHMSRKLADIQDLIEIVNSVFKTIPNVNGGLPT